jgi:hypothetical protein
MSIEKIQEYRLKTSSSTKPGLRRCYECNCHFGLVRKRCGLKQFCSTRCLLKYKAGFEQATSRIKQWAHFLTQKM